MPVANAITRFSDRVEEYVRYRPGYPEEVLRVLRERCGLTPQSVVADVGCGPGNLARLFLENGNTVFAIEPNSEMRAAGERLLTTYPAFRSISGTAEDTTLDGDSIDFATAGQAFHWFDWRKARQEFKRILRPSGWAVLVWNQRLTDTTPFLRDYEALLLDFGTDYAQVRHEISYENIAGFFGGPYETAELENVQDVDYDGLRGRLLSSSYVPGPNHERRAPMLEALQRIFQKHERNGRVAVEYSVRMHFGHLA